MGLNISDIIPREKHSLSDYSGKLLAVDAYNTIYQFLTTIRQADGTPLKNSDGAITSHLAGIVYRNANLAAAGIRLVYVFDGRPHELKKETIAQRKAVKVKAEEDYRAAVEEGDMERARSFAARTARITPDILEQSKQLLHLLGIPCVDALSDGEAQAAYMAAKGDVWGLVSQDYDSIIFGAPHLVRNLSGGTRRKLPRQRAYVTVEPETIHLDTVLDTLGVTREQLVDMAVLIGTDFNEGVKGIGQKKSLKLIKEFGTLERIIEAKGFDLSEEEYSSVRDIFLRPQVTDDYSMERPGLDENGVLDYLVNGFRFSVQRVENALAKYRRQRESMAQRTLFDF